MGRSEQKGKPLHLKLVKNWYFAPLPPPQSTANLGIMGVQEFQILSKYNQWANRRIFDVVKTLPDDTYRKDMGAFFGSIHATLNHILVIDRLWSSRIMGEYHGIKSLDQILHDDLEALRKDREIMDEHIIRLTGRLTAGMDGGLNREVYYRMLKGGEKHVSPARHILLTLFNHHTHHRGQVHCMLTQSGVKDIPPLDIIFYLRENDEI